MRKKPPKRIWIIVDSRHSGDGLLDAIAFTTRKAAEARMAEDNGRHFMAYCEPVAYVRVEP